jgi:hypothetical protein
MNCQRLARVSDSASRSKSILLKVAFLITTGKIRPSDSIVPKQITNTDVLVTSMLDKMAQARR